MNRRIFLPVFLATLCALFPPARAQDKAELYRRDIEFLLEELPKRAGRFFTLKKIDWPKVAERFRTGVQNVRTDEDHLKLCSQLMAALKDGHAGLLDAKVKWRDESKGRSWSGPGMHLVQIGNDVYVRSASGKAAAAGVRAGAKVDTIDGSPAKAWLEKKAAELGDLRGFSTLHQALYAACHGGLADWSGTPMTIEFTDPNGAAKGTRLIREGQSNFVPVGPVHPVRNLKAVDRNAYGKTEKGFAYIHLRKIPGDLETQLDGMLAEIGDAPGLILDMRANTGGGCNHPAVFSRFVPKERAWGNYPSAGPNPYGGPMVVIFDAGVASAGETVGGMFKEDGRAYAIGDSPTAGMSSSKERLPLPSGLFTAYFSVHSNKARFNQGRGIEGVGVPPHEIVSYDAAELAAGVDTQIRRAEELLAAGFPAGAVRYEHPRPR